MFCVSVHVRREVWVTQLPSVWLIIGNPYIPMLFRSHTPPSLCCHIINKTLMTRCHEKPEVPLLSVELTMLWIVNLFKRSLEFFLLIILVKVHFQFDQLPYYSHVIFSVRSFVLCWIGSRCRVLVDFFSFCFAIVKRDLSVLLRHDLTVINHIFWWADFNLTSHTQTGLHLESRNHLGCVHISPV